MKPKLTPHQKTVARRAGAQLAHNAKLLQAMQQPQHKHIATSLRALGRQCLYLLWVRQRECTYAGLPSVAAHLDAAHAKLARQLATGCGGCP